MEVLLTPDGYRDRRFRPYIEEEEQANSVYLYDPSRGFNYGLYTGAQPTCGSWHDLYLQYPSKVPVSTVDSLGRLHMTRRYPNRYEQLWRHGALR